MSQSECSPYRIERHGMDKAGIGAEQSFVSIRPNHPPAPTNKTFDQKDAHHDLETVEAPRFSGLNLVGEPLDEVLVDDTVRGSEEGQNVGNEVAFVVVELVVPVVLVLGQIHLFGSPERCLGFLVHLPDLLKRCHKKWVVKEVT